MKIALYIEDGLEQIVLTPESETEKGILGKLSDGSRQLSIKKGEFYYCRGGWVRESQNTSKPESTMVVLTHVIVKTEPFDLEGVFDETQA